MTLYLAHILEALDGVNEELCTKAGVHGVVLVLANIIVLDIHGNKFGPAISVLEPRDKRSEEQWAVRRSSRSEATSDLSLPDCYFFIRCL